MILHWLIERASDGALKNVFSLRFCPFESEAGTIQEKKKSLALYLGVWAEIFSCHWAEVEMTHFQRRGREETSAVLVHRLKNFCPSELGCHLLAPSLFPWRHLSISLFYRLALTVLHKLDSSQESPGFWLKTEVSRTWLQRLVGLEGGEGNVYCDKTFRKSDDHANLGICPNEAGFSLQHL